MYKGGKLVGGGLVEVVDKHAQRLQRLPTRRLRGVFTFESKWYIYVKVSRNCTLHWSRGRGQVTGTSPGQC